MRHPSYIYLEITRIAIKGNNHQPDFLFDVDKYNTKWEVKNNKTKTKHIFPVAMFIAFLALVTILGLSKWTFIKFFPDIFFITLNMQQQPATACG